MSAQYTPTSSAQGGLVYADDYDDAKGQGLVTFAGVLLFIVGTLNTVYGIAAIDSAHVFVNKAQYVFGDLNTFGWFVLAFGVLQMVAAFAIWRGTSWARWFGVACASCNLVLQILWLPSFPFLALAIIPLDVIALYGLLCYGGRRASYRAVKARAEQAAAS
jgi:uncharacterized membrane protein (DUF2068 family)